MQLRDAFDTVAEVYDAIRPGYPEPLFDEIAVVAGLLPDDRILEVGCGSGQATASLLARGYQVTALDPGPALIAAAGRRLGPEAKVRFVTARFEGWAPPARAFRLVAAAQAWHWTPPAQAFPRAAAALADGGWLAIFGHVPVRFPAEFQAAAQPLCMRYAPGLWAAPPETWYLPGGPLPGLIGGSGLFQRPRHSVHPWTWRHTPESFRQFLASRSDIQLIPEPRRSPLIAGLGAIVAEQGGALEIGYETHLYMAARQ
ncbi:class I SAM-dependent methyltransferase [Phenylobacterium sp.]|uniref:class I SAM-dependent methyltransferase n=1 Tax=Phenylobacterium sp. TaxID=1871053 RepID=UPI0026114A6D|nr:class I SAM-dependent methyltransferase [Phenylobacterium sp.]